PDEQCVLGKTPAHAACELAKEPRFADAGGADDDGGARRRLLECARGEALELHELDVATDAGRGPAEKEGRVVVLAFVAEKLVRAVARIHEKMALQKGRADGVDANGLGNGRQLEQLRRAVDGVADVRRGAERGATGGEGDAR